MNTGSREKVKKILVVDDQPWVTEFYLSELASDEAKIRTANTLQLTKDIIISFQPDLVVLDSLLGNLDVLETIRLMRETNSAVPVFVITKHNKELSGSKITRFSGYQIQSDTLLEIQGNLAEILEGQLSQPPEKQP